MAASATRSVSVVGTPPHHVRQKRLGGVTRLAYFIAIVVSLGPSPLSQGRAIESQFALSFGARGMGNTSENVAQAFECPSPIRGTTLKTHDRVRATRLGLGESARLTATACRLVVMPRL
jgi:hypothetical protein